MNLIISHRYELKYGKIIGWTKWSGHEKTKHDSLGIQRNPRDKGSKGEQNLSYLCPIYSIVADLWSNKIQILWQTFFECNWLLPFSWNLISPLPTISLDLLPPKKYFYKMCFMIISETICTKVSMKRGLESINPETDFISLVERINYFHHFHRLY